MTLAKVHAEWHIVRRLVHRRIAEFEYPRFPTTMPSNNKKKSLKDIKTKDVVHPYSRKAMQIRRAHTRTDKLTRGLTTRVTNRSLEAERYLWFRYAMDDEREVLTVSELHELMESYIARNDEEIQTLKDGRRKGQPPPKKLQMLETLRKQNQSEYANGMVIPDLTDKATVIYIRFWDGDMNGKSNMQLLTLNASSASKTSVASSMDSSTAMQDDPPTLIAM